MNKTSLLPSISSKNMLKSIINETKSKWLIDDENKKAGYRVPMLKNSRKYPGYVEHIRPVDPRAVNIEYKLH